MNHLKLIHQYLKERGSIRGIPPSGLPFITISREAGAGGHLLAHVILTDFLKQKDRGLFEGWHVFDRELCEVVAGDPELQASMEELLAEKHRSEFAEFIDSLFSGRARQYEIYKKTFAIVRLLGCLGKVIIVGRAASCVCADLPGGVHIRIVAPEAQRIRWLGKKLKITREEARIELLRQEDDKRRLVSDFFDKDINDPLLYHTVWNSGRVDMHTISESVIELVRLQHQALCQAK
jgi:cytidylate kinase